MKTINDGGPAFPVATEYSEKIESSAGLSIRDYFAAKAMQGLCVRAGPHDAAVMAHDAYLIADAMLKAREAR